MTSRLQDRYELIRQLGEGGKSTVHEAWDVVDRQYRAIKILHPRYRRRPILARFERSGRMIMQWDHPNVIKGFDLVDDPDAVFQVLELADGGSVKDWLGRHGRAMPPRMAVRILLDACAGIQALHAQGAIHRNIKPGNLLLDRRGRCKVGSLDIAKWTQGPGLTRTGTVMGTIGYMAPEQHESAKHVDERADVYSIAATLYTMLTNTTPVHLFMCSGSDYVGVPAPLAELMKKGAQYRANLRHQSVAEMAVELRAALDVLPPDPPGTPPLVSQDHRAESPASPRAPGCGVGLAALLLAIAVTIAAVGWWC